MKGFFPVPQLPLIAILRGLLPEKAEATGAALIEQGITVIEVPLNREGALQSIEILARVFGSSAIIGAGTVLTPEDVRNVINAGGTLIVSPDTNTHVIYATVAAGVWSIPGAATPTEAFAALHAGANGIKIFPAEACPPEVLKSMRAVLPKDLPVFPVGGITPEKMKDYVKAGANGFGIGSPIFTPDRSVEEIAERARRFAEAFKII
jgi:2-dehydro-3-deoxyphosphogalactonate aldolase